MNNKHEFAIYYADLNNQQAQTIIQIQDDIAQRLHSILRLTVGESVILFNSTGHARATITQYKNKKTILLSVEKIAKNEQFFPNIICLLPILKRQAFDEALYTLAQMGVSFVQPISSNKSTREWGTEKDFERAKNIFIAAAEQSKQFILPTIKSVISLQEAVQMYANEKHIFFDAAGEPASSIMKGLIQAKKQSLVVCFGPEGDLTHDEKTLLIKNDYQFCALTQSILKSEQAIALACGMLRALLR